MCKLGKPWTGPLICSTPGCKTYFDVTEVAEKVVVSSLWSGYEATEHDSFADFKEGVMVHPMTAVVNAVNETVRM